MSLPLCLQVSVVRTSNCIYEILQQRQRDIEFREASNDHRQRYVTSNFLRAAMLDKILPIPILEITWLLFGFFLQKTKPVSLPMIVLCFT